MEKVNRWIFYILGMVVLAAGITLNTKTGLGVSPIISVAYCVSQIFELNFGDMTFVLYGIFVVVQLFLRERRERLATLLQFPLSLVFSRLLNLCSACIPYQAAAHSLPENLAVLALSLIHICVLLPEIQAFFESEEGQREFAEWKAQQKKDKAKQR